MKKTLFIEVYDSENSEEPYSFIKVGDTITEKDFHYEISDWFLKNVNPF